MNDFWLKQGGNKPLFSDLLWDKPENKHSAGRLLIIGGQKDHFSKVSTVFENTSLAGAGFIRVLLPSSLEKIVRLLPDVELSPNNKSGGFGSNSLAQIEDLSQWADITVLAGDFGKSSETSSVLDKYLLKNSKLVAISENCFESIDIKLINKQDVLVVVGLSGLQKLQKEFEFDKSFTSSLGLPKFAENLSKFSARLNCLIVCKYADSIWAAVDGKVSSTKGQVDNEKLLSFASVWLMQNPSKPFEALTTACYEITI